MNKKLITVVTLISLLSLSVFVSANENLLVEGISDFYNGLYNEAINNFTLLLAKDNDNIDALYYQTLAYLKLDEITKAKANIDLLNDEGYSFGTIHWRLGELYLNKNQSYDSPFYNEAKK